MNIYEKLQKIKLELLKCKLKKSGENKFAGFKYYELSDLMPDIIRLCEQHKVCTMVNFDDKLASLTAFDCEATDTKKESVSPPPTVCCPIEKLELKGANSVQALGGTITYLRRYLYMSMFDITEADMLDAISGKAESQKYCCDDCNAEFKGLTGKDNKWYSAAQVYKLAENANSDKKARCKSCREKGGN